MSISDKTNQWNKLALAVSRDSTADNLQYSQTPSPEEEPVRCHISDATNQWNIAALATNPLYL